MILTVILTALITTVLLTVSLYAVVRLFHLVVIRDEVLYEVIDQSITLAIAQMEATMETQGEGQSWATRRSTKRN